MDNGIQVGTIVIAKKPFLECSIGAFGVCYEQYKLRDRPGWSFIIENGDYDGFSQGDVDPILHLPGAHCFDLASYMFTNVTRLSKDYERGVFEPAFAMARNLDPSLLLPAHRGRVSWGNEDG